LPNIGQSKSQCNDKEKLFLDINVLSGNSRLSLFSKKHERRDMPQHLCMKLELVLFKQKNQHGSSEHILRLK